MVPSGLLRHRINLLSPSADTDDDGQALPPTVFRTVWSQIKPMSGSELYRAQQFTEDATIQVIIRYLPGVSAVMTVGYGTRTFQILAVLNELERNEQLTLLCKEINGGPS